MGGGKSGGAAAPPALPEVQDFSQDIYQMQGMINDMNTRLVDFETAPMPEIAPPEMPQVEEVESIDFEQVAADAAAQAGDEMVAEQEASRGTLDTILTNPLLDEEEANTTGSLLG